MNKIKWIKKNELKKNGCADLEPNTSKLHQYPSGDSISCITPIMHNSYLCLKKNNKELMQTL